MFLWIITIILFLVLICRLAVLERRISEASEQRAKEDREAFDRYLLILLPKAPLSSEIIDARVLNKSTEYAIQQASNILKVRRGLK